MWSGSENGRKFLERKLWPFSIALMSWVLILGADVKEDSLLRVMIAYAVVSQPPLPHEPFDF